MSSFANISAREHAGLQMALQLAKTYYDHQPVSIAEIAKREHLSSKYLEQLIVPFKKAGWITSQRGREGGYVMTKNPDEISLKEFMQVLNEDVDTLKLVNCLHSEEMHCPVSANCTSVRAWKQVQDSIESTMQNITFKKLLNK